MRPRPHHPRAAAAVEPLERRQLLSTTYYVSPTGRDANPGTSAAQPLQTLAAVDRLKLAAGDAVLLAGGATFAGTVALTAAAGGTAASPITIASYGTGRATVAAGAGDGIDVIDTSGVVIRDLNVEGDHPDNDTSQGIKLFNDRTGGGRLDQGVTITHVDVAGFGLWGIGIGAATLTDGFAHVSVTHATLHDDDEAGLQSYAGDYTASPAPYGLAHSDLYVAYVTAYDNPGNAIHLDSGSGILLGGVQDATVEHCVAHDNGANRLGGPVGIWTYNSDRVTIQYNQSYGNDGGPTDGDGFDLDGGTTNSTVQYNYSHDNAGAGVLLCQFPGATAWSGNVVRYNVSQDDGRRNGYGGIDLWTGAGAAPLADSQVYGNTVYVSPAAGSDPAGLRVRGATSSVAFHNNVFDVAPGLRPLVVTDAGTGLTLAGNDYWDGSATDLNLDWLGTTYGTLADWRAATGQERLNGADTGLAADPRLADPGDGGTPATADALATAVPAYQLTGVSPLIDAGVSLTALGINPGPTDFYGTPLPQGGGFDVGAAEWGGPVPADEVTPTPAVTTVSVAVSPAATVASGTPVTLTATVSASPARAVTGTVTFALPDGTPLGTAAVGAAGTAAVTTAYLPTGVTAVTARFASDDPGAYGGSAAVVTVTANPPGPASTVVRSTLPTTTVAGTPHVRGTVTLAITNTAGGIDAGRATIELFAAPGGALDGSAVAVARTVRRLTLRAGRPVTVTVPVAALPTTLAAGTYNWMARVTDAAGVASISPAGPALTVRGATVALSATVLSNSLPATVVAGKRVGRTVVLAVTNGGNTATTGPLTVSLSVTVGGLLVGTAVQPLTVPVATAKSRAVVHPGGPAVRLTVRLAAVPKGYAGSYAVSVVVTDAIGNTATVTLPASLTVA